MSRTRQCDTDPLNRARRTLVPGFEAEAVRAPEEGRRLGRGRGRGLDSLSMRARARTRGMARGSSEQRRQRGEAAERRRENVAFSKSRLRVTTHQVRTPAPDAQASPRWSSGYDSALSQPRAGFDSPSGNHKRALRRVLFFLLSSASEPSPTGLCCPQRSFCDAAREGRRAALAAPAVFHSPGRARSVAADPPACTEGYSRCHSSNGLSAGALCGKPSAQPTLGDEA